MGFIISIVGEKGGTGKSTLAQNLSVYFQQEDSDFIKDLILVDTDIPQRTTSDWADIRNQNPDIMPINIIEKSGNILPTLISLSTKYDLVIVDCGGHDNEAGRSALAVSSLVLLPIRPKRRDLRSLIKMEFLFKEVKIMNPELILRSIITQCPSLPSQKIRIDNAKTICESYGMKALETVIYQRNAYDDCEEQGLSILEYYDVKAKEEMTLIGQAVELLLKQIDFIDD